jgi:hypothetical protein
MSIDPVVPSPSVRGRCDWPFVVGLANQFPGRQLMDAILDIPIVLPPTVFLELSIGNIEAAFRQ